MLKYFLFLLISLNVVFSENYPMPVIIDGKLAYINSKGEFEIKPNFECTYEIESFVYNNKNLKYINFNPNVYFSEDLASVRNPFGLWFIYIGYDYFVINTKGEKIITNDDIEYGKFSEGLASSFIQKKTLEYVYNRKPVYVTNGDSLLELKDIQFAGPFSNNRAMILKNNNFGFINKNREVAINLNYQDASSFSEGLAAVEIGNKWEFIDTLGNKAINNTFEKVWNFKNGLARFSENNKFNYIDKNGKVKAFNNFKHAFDFSEGFAGVGDGTSYYFIDTNLRKVFNQEFDNLGFFSDGLAAVDIQGKWGFIDSHGNIVIEPKFDYALEFKNDLAVAWIDNKTIYINKKGETIFQLYPLDDYCLICEILNWLVCVPFFVFY